MYKKIFMLFVVFMISGVIFMSCSSDDDGGGTTPTPDPKLSIISPNGGEIVQMGEDVWIHFENELDGDVAIYLYKNGDSLDVVDPLITVQDSTLWLVPTTLDSDKNYKLKIVSVDDPSIYDFSDAEFIIAPVGDYIMVNSSDGGDIWLKGSTHSITWYTNMTGTVRIDLYKDNMPYLLIYNNQANDGTQGWTIPNDITIDASADYTLRIQSVENISIYDESDNFFCLAEDRDDQNIIGDWTTTFSKQPTTFYFEADGTIVADSLGTEMGVGTWEMIGNGVKITDELSSAHLIGIVDGDNMDGTMADDSGYNGDWTAERVIPELLTPNGGEVWMHGTQDSITWDPSIAGNVVISLADTTGVVQPIATVLGSDGLYVWTVPATIDPGAAYLIRIAKEINGEAMDQSDNFICISSDVTVDILGQWDFNWYWKAMAVIEFFNDNTWSYGTYKVTGNGIRWDYTTSDTYYIGIIDGDKMSGTMTDGHGITGIGWDAQRILDILTPNGGEVFDMGDIVNITWDETLTASEISVDLYENDVFVENLGIVNINTYTSFNWTVPNYLTTSTKYKIRITSTTSDIYDECDNYFTINGVAPAAFEDENFEDGVADNWTAVNGNWAVVDSISVYQGTGTTQTNSAVLDSAKSGNFVYEVKMKKVAGVYYYGININGDHTTLDGWGQWNSMLFYIDISSDEYSFRRNLGGSWTSLATGTSSAVNLGLDQWNTFKVIVVNETNDYHLFINDEYLGTVHDTTYTGGELGLFQWESVGGVIDVDYVKVTPINKSDLDKINIRRISNSVVGNEDPFIPGK
ncbi:MAG: hypothetical protein JXR69_00415 [Candidatus Delongbacteria bacterium]|nr:hypothetical protein [Candidatus Delongbacteria bacterium]